MRLARTLGGNSQRYQHRHDIQLRAHTVLPREPSKPVSFLTTMAPAARKASFRDPPRNSSVLNSAALSGKAQMTTRPSLCKYALRKARSLSHSSERGYHRRAGRSGSEWSQEARSGQKEPAARRAGARKRGRPPRVPAPAPWPRPA